MQLVPPLTQDSHRAAAERSVGTHLPYAAQIDDATILLRDGRLMQVIRIEGLLFETLDGAEIDYRKDMRDAVLRSIGSSRFALYHHVLRRRVATGLTGTFPDPLSQAIDDIWRARLADREMFVNEQFIAIIRRPNEGRSRGARALLGRLAGKGPDAPAHGEDLRALTAAREALVASLSAYRPALLQVYETPTGLFSEPLEYLAALYNGDLEPVLMPEGSIADYLPRRRISFGAETAELGGHAGSGRSFIAIVSIKDYPGATAPGMLDALQRLPFEMTITQSFALVDRSASLGRLNLTLRRMRAADDEALVLRDELMLARDAVASGKMTFGEHHMTVAVRGDTPAQVDAGVAEVQAAMTELGIVAVREDIGLEAAF